MNYYDFLTKKLAQTGTQGPVQITSPISKGANPFLGNIFNPNQPSLKLDGNSIFASAKKEDLDKIDYSKIAGKKDDADKTDEEKKLSPLEFVIKEFLSLDKVKEKADDNHDGDLTIDEIKDYIKELIEKDGNADDLSLEDFEAVIKELGIDLDELSNASESGEAQATENQAQTIGDVQSQADSNPAETAQQPVQTEAPAAASAPSTSPKAQAVTPTASSAPQPKTLDNMSLEELQAEKTTRVATQSQKQNAVNAAHNGQNENVKAAKADEKKAREEYEKAIQEDPGAKKFAKDILKNNQEIEKNQQALDENAIKITDTELKISEAESSLEGAKGELSSLEASLSALSSDKNNKDKVKSLKDEISAKKKEISKKEKELKDLKKSLEKLNKEKQKLEKEKTNLEEKKAELDQKVKQFCSEETKAKLEAFNKAKAKVNEVKSAELSKANGELTTAKTAVAEVNKKINEALKRKANKSSGSSDEIVEAAQAELAKGVHENNGNNDSPDIRRYKHGAANSAQWCAYFTSYCCEQAGHKPFSYTGSSQQIKNEAIRAGHYAQKNTGYTPKPGDLAIWTKTPSTGHVGIVETVNPDGSFTTIEGNSSDRVKRNHYASQSSVSPTFNGFVKMSEWQA